MKTKLSKIADDLEQGTITNNEAQALLLGLIDITKRFSFIEINNILSKPKLVLFKKDLKNIMITENGIDYKSSDDCQFINKYAGKEAIVYEWCGGWWIAEDDDYLIPRICFETID